ncbi:S9 family peptidase [Telluria aromaticivorans]|uniref:S9 family peptidase n=1 Tax=Telluria aromaticivorans TaxID=2725995 RepID=A0A7Y2P1G4_9BURK|nr:S9 family peptidase [Telluria aromaticivorans]NNG25198.1 S9 family peptidase [Telluria aromaticivorans]
MKFRLPNLLPNLLQLVPIAAATLAATTAMAAPRGFTVEDLVNMERVGSPAVSPDANRVVYTVRSTDMGKNRGHTELWMVDLRAAKPAPQRLASHASSSTDPEWSPSGDAIYFLSTRSGSSQVWRQPVDGGKARGKPAKVTDLPLDVDSFRVSPTGERIAMSMSVFRDCLELACTRKRADAKAKDKASGKLYDRLFVRHWDTWNDHRNAVLFSAPLDASGKAGSTPVSLSGSLDGDVPSKPFGDREEFRFSPDGKTIVFSVRLAGKTEAWSTNFDLYTVPAAGGAAPRNLTPDNPAWDAKGVYSPDGRTLAYLAMARPGFEADRFQVMLMDMATGSTRKLAVDWDRSVGSLQWRADGKALIVDAEDLGQRRLYSIDVDSGKVAALTDKGAVGAFDVRGDTVAYTQANLASGAQLFSMKLGSQPTQLTTLNTERLKDVRWGQYEQFSFKGANGDTVYGHVMKPWNAEPGKKYPVAFLVHGGPQGSFGNGWSYRWNPQVYAGAGYATVFIDFHGSTGYGQKFTDSISGDWGGKPLEDLQKGLDAAVQKFPWLDRGRSCALGASYGGYMMNWIAGNWNDGFRCLVNHDGVFDNRGMAYSTEEQWFTDWENGGAYFAVPQNHERFNPVHHVNKWKTPMLVIQGDLDFRIPTAQALSTFTALQRKGIDSQLLVFPDENHWVLKPANSLQWHHTVINWLDKHLKQ